MRRHAFRSLCAFIAAITFFVSAPLAQAQGEEKPKSADTPKTKEKGGQRSVFQGYYATIVRELKMTDEQKSKMETILKARAAAIKMWDETNKAKVDELTAAEAKAKEAKDTEGARKITAERRALNRARTAIENDYRKQWQALLTPEQAVHLRGYGVYTGTLARFPGIETTAEQKAKVKAMALEANKGATETTGEAWNKLRDDLAAKVEKEILTEEQRAKVAAEKAKSKDKTKSATPPAAAPK